jgi:hypothetical protein
VKLGELTADHIGRTIKVRRDSPARVIAGVRHYTIPDKDAKGVLRRTSVMLRSTGAKGNDHFGEHIGDSSDEVTVSNA